MSPKTRTKSSPSWLSLLEQKELERRGFLVKDFLNWDMLVKNFPLQAILLAIFSVLGFLVWWGLLILWYWTNWVIYSMILSVFWVFIFIIWQSLIPYILFGKIFYINSRKSIFWYNWELVQNNNWLIALILGRIQRSSLTLKSMIQWTKKKDIFWIFFLPIIIAMNIFWNQLINDVIWVDLLFWYTFPLIGFILLLYWLTQLFRQLIEHFHPLYAFGNLGSRIQSLTPRISETSEKIEKEFSTDMNFRTLSRSFDTLSKDFSEISSYVLKLEQIEKKANKWNLFDSEKYIGSLREDIVKPLTTLRSFLEKKKTELQSSQEEMKKVRVRVGWSWHTWWNWEIENLELQSKRSEPLREELTENIEKLDVMIEKFGKI